MSSAENTNIVIVTGSCGLIGADAVRFYAPRCDKVVGIDNDMRSAFFGAEASTRSQRDALQSSTRNYEHVEADIRISGHPLTQDDQ